MNLTAASHCSAVALLPADGHEHGPEARGAL